jgi:hypothetical protein
MAQLHEILAVDQDLQNLTRKVLEEATNTFSKKQDHFLGNYKKLSMFNEARKAEEEGFKEQKEIVTTVQDKLDYVGEGLARYVDVVAQKEATNQVAKADLVLPDGSVLAKDLPATLLLALENKLLQWRSMYEAIPTLSPGVHWVPDEEKGKNIFRAETDLVRHKTEKVLQTRVIFNPTDKQAGQYEKWMEDVPVGQYEETRWSSMISPARKSELLGRIDVLIGAVKQARMRANTAEIVKLEIGAKIVAYINR